MAILLEEVEKSISDPLSGPVRIGLVGGHPNNGMGQRGIGEGAERRVECSGDSARKDMSQSDFPPLDPRNPHRANPLGNDRLLLPTPRFNSLFARVFATCVPGEVSWMANVTSGKKRAADGDPDGAQPLTKRFGYLQIGKAFFRR